MKTKKKKKTQKNTKKKHPSRLKTTRDIVPQPTATSATTTIIIPPTTHQNGGFLVSLHEQKPLPLISSVTLTSSGANPPGAFLCEPSHHGCDAESPQVHHHLEPPAGPRSTLRELRPATRGTEGAGTDDDICSLLGGVLFLLKTFVVVGDVGVGVGVGVVSLLWLSTVLQLFLLLLVLALLEEEEELLLLAVLVVSTLADNCSFFFFFSSDGLAGQKKNCTIGWPIGGRIHVWRNVEGGRGWAEGLP
jgi:hypothetical protein